MLVLPGDFPDGWRDDSRRSRVLRPKIPAFFASFERFTHWLTQAASIVLAASGLNISLVCILISAAVRCAGVSRHVDLRQFAHDYLAFPVHARARRHVPDLDQGITFPGRSICNGSAGGGILSKRQHRPARRFNAGQKGISGS